MTGGTSATRRRLAAAGVVACLPVLAAIPARTQDTAGGRTLGFSFSQRLETDDGEVSAITRLGLALAARTETQSLTFDISSGAEAFLDGRDQDAFVLSDPLFRLGYDIETQATALSFDASYLRRDVDGVLDAGDLGLATDFLVLDPGTRTDLTAGLGLEFGRDAPFGGTVSLSVRDLSYTDTSDPDLIDRTDVAADVALRFEINPLLTARLNAAASRSDEEGRRGTDVERLSYGAGVSVAVTRTLAIEAEVGQTRIEEVEPLGGRRQVGTTLSLGVVAERPNGALSGRVFSNLGQNGRRSGAVVSRSLALPRGALEGSVGVTRPDGFGLQPLVSLAWRQELPREGAVNLSINQALSVSSNDFETVNTNLTLGWSQELTPVDAVEAGIALRDRNVLSAAGEDARQIDLTLGYRRALAADWGAVAGYTRSWVQQDGSADRTEDKIFLGLQKSFLWRF